VTLNPRKASINDVEASGIALLSVTSESL
jgi:hypothetical protein